MQLKLSDMPENIIAHYHLLDITTPDGYVYCEIHQGMGSCKQGSLLRSSWQKD